MGEEQYGTQGRETVEDGSPPSLSLDGPLAGSASDPALADMIAVP